MSERWVLVPARYWQDVATDDIDIPKFSEWLDAAVERGAKAMCRLEGSRIPGDMGCAECEGECDVLDEGLSDLARAAILAALEMTDG